MSKKEHGVFTSSNSSGFYQNLNKQGNQLPPTESLKDVGIPSSVYSTRDISPSSQYQHYNLYSTNQPQLNGR
jgi:hypothetical protein